MNTKKVIYWQGHGWLEVRLRAESAEPKRLLKYFINPSNAVFLPTCSGMRSVFSPAWIAVRSAGCIFSTQFSANVFILFSVLLVVTLKYSWLCRKGLSHRGGLELWNLKNKGHWGCNLSGPRLHKREWQIEVFSSSLPIQSKLLLNAEFLRGERTSGFVWGDPL